MVITECAKFSTRGLFRSYLPQPTFDDPRNKPLISLWAQWYIGLMVPPLMLALLTQEKALDVSPEHVHVEFHETGRAACFWVDVCEDKTQHYIRRSSEWKR